MKIAFFEVNPEEEKFFKASLPTDELFFSPDPLNLATLPHKEFEVITSHTNSKIDSSVIDSLPNLKLIATRTTGFDHIDYHKATSRNIVVSNVPTYGEITVAEYTIALLLSFSRKIPIAYNRVRSGEFETDGLEGFDLNAKTLGVIGTGHIGVHVIKIAKGFGMNILAFDAFPNQNLQQDLGFTYTTLEDVFQKSDIITFHVPALPQTEHMLNSNNLSLLKKGMVVINTSRGSVIESACLVKGLEDGTIKGVAADVIENETTFQNDPNAALNNELINHPNVIITPHNAFNTTEAKQRILQTTLDNIKAFTQGKPQNIVGNK